MKLADTGNEYEAREQSGDFALLIGGVGANPERARTIRDEIIHRVNAYDALVKACAAMLNPMVAELDPSAREFESQNQVDVARNMARAALALAAHTERLSQNYTQPVQKA